VVWLKTLFAMWKLTRRLLSTNLSMQARRTIFAQQNAKNNLNLGQNNMRVPRKKDVSDGSRFGSLVGVPVSDGTPLVAAEKSQLRYCFLRQY